MNRKVGSTHNVKRMLFSFSSPPLYMPRQHSRLLTFLNLTHGISMTERQTERTLSKSHSVRERGEGEAEEEERDTTPLSVLSGRRDKEEIILNSEDH